tara:strand:- start:191 stop:493 length:303 start_codon:yes stop_codon:yes gene_type:complete
MNWENILKVKPITWQRFVIHLLREGPTRSWTAKAIIDNLIDNSTISGATDKPQHPEHAPLKYKNIPRIRKLRDFLIRDDRIRVISGQNRDEYIWAGGEEE